MFGLRDVDAKSNGAEEKEEISRDLSALSPFIMVYTDGILRLGKEADNTYKPDDDVSTTAVFKLVGY
jgi:hypothetical protein